MRAVLPSTIEFTPIVVVDTREQSPLVFQRLPSEVGTLGTGDYSFKGGEELFAVERKSQADLVSCCLGENRSRFERELHRLRGFRFKRLLVIGSIADIEASRYHSAIKPQSVLASLAAWEIRYDVPVAWCASPAIAAQQIESWICWFAREQLKLAHALAPNHLHYIPRISRKWDLFQQTLDLCHVGA